MNVRANSAYVTPEYKPTNVDQSTDIVQIDVLNRQQVKIVYDNYIQLPILLKWLVTLISVVEIYLSSSYSIIVTI